jgi:hypothetical protein
VKLILQDALVYMCKKISSDNAKIKQTALKCLSAYTLNSDIVPFIMIGGISHTLLALNSNQLDVVSLRHIGRIIANCARGSKSASFLFGEMGAVKPLQSILQIDVESTEDNVI